MLRIVLLLMVSSFLVSACGDPTMDMQGLNPVDYYEKHPIKNTVQTSYHSQTVTFLPSNRLTPSSIEELRSEWYDISPAAIQSIQVQMRPAFVNNAARREHISKLLGSMGFNRTLIVFEPSKEVGATNAQIDISFAKVVLPRCPDWRVSPISTHANGQQANIGCATTVNLGLMVADPRDLEKGHGVVGWESERNAMVLQQYRAGSGGASADSSSGSSGASGAASAGQ